MLKDYEVACIVDCLYHETFQSALAAKSPDSGQAQPWLL